MEPARISYRGVSICPDAKGEAAGEELTIHTAAPMPVGTELRVALGEEQEREATVTAVAEGAAAWMRLRPAYRPVYTPPPPERKRGGRRKKAED